MFMSRYMPCPYCGASIEQTSNYTHVCDPARRAEFEAFALRDDLARLEEEFRTWLESTTGRFELWLATRKVKR